MSKEEECTPVYEIRTAPSPTTTKPFKSTPNGPAYTCFVAMSTSLNETSTSLSPTLTKASNWIRKMQVPTTFVVLLTLRRGELDRAVADFDMVIQLDPKQWKAYLDRGRAYYEKGDHDRAIADLDKAIQLSAQDAHVYNLRGIAYARKGDSAHSIADFSKAIEIDPDNDFGYFNRGIAYSQNGDYDRAILDFDKTIQLNPNRTGCLRLSR